MKLELFDSEDLKDALPNDYEMIKHEASQAVSQAAAGSLYFLTVLPPIMLEDCSCAARRRCCSAARLNPMTSFTSCKAIFG